MPSITLRNVSNFICKNANLHIKDGEFFVLLGPMGSGKTTMLNIIAGLADYDGSVFFDDTPIDELGPQQRGVGYLPQDLLLFPHMTVEENIGYGMKVKLSGESAIKGDVDELMEMMGLGHLKKRYPKNLSGGEKQRVALARALASNPKVLLLDEPFTNIDPRMNHQLRLELVRLQKKLGITTIYVTHNLSEAEDMSSRVGIISDGQIQQVSSFKEALLYPKNANVLDFIGNPNIIECNSARMLTKGLVELRCGNVTIVAPYGEDLDNEKQINRIVIFPRDILISQEKIRGSQLNLFSGKVIDASFAGPIVHIRVKIGGGPIVSAEISRDVYNSKEYASGNDIFIRMKFNAIKVI